MSDALEKEIWGAEQQGTPTPRTEIGSKTDCPRTDAFQAAMQTPSTGGDRMDWASFARQLERELIAIREALTGEDYASLPSDIPTVRMAHEIRSDRDKFLQQVRDTCSRAEKAERELSRSREDCEKLWDAAAFLRDLKTMKEALETQRGPVLTLAGGQVDRSVIQKYYDDNKERAWGNLRAALSTTRKEEGNG